MDSEDAILAFAALAQDTRLAAFRLLLEHAPDGLPAGDIATRLVVPANTLSSHLAILTRAGLVEQERRSRNIVYRADPGRVGCLVAFLVDTCCGGDPGACGLPALPSLTPRSTVTKAAAMSDRVYNVLFLCTGNSARSIMAEGILTKEGRGRFRAFSAGSHPKGDVHPLALKMLELYDCPTAGLRSKSWDEFAVAGAPRMDFVFTVCDDAAGETCPAWPGQPITAHWGIADPAAAQGSDVEKQAAFVSAFKFLRNRILPFLALPAAALDAVALTERLDALGRLEGATTKALAGPAKAEAHHE